ncbi:MAG: hypothetical protein DRO11_03380 [Methanobacteriota archaeon]|nr:MAG: hypothetical protein DRO11_03380 [Euryarchaeota archaeon]
MVGPGFIGWFASKTANTSLSRCYFFSTLFRLYVKKIQECAPKCSEIWIRLDKLCTKPYKVGGCTHSGWPTSVTLPVGAMGSWPTPAPSPPFYTTQQK